MLYNDQHTVLNVNKYFHRWYFIILCFSLGSLEGWSQSNSSHSVARQWCDVLLEGIRGDFARPTVHARNLYHTTMVMYDAWAVYDDSANTVLLDQTFGDFKHRFTGIPHPSVFDPEMTIKEAQEMAISYAAYRLLTHRFEDSPSGANTIRLFNDLFKNLGYNPNEYSTNYELGNPAALGNYIGELMIDLGLEDGSFEEFDYADFGYSPYNEALTPTEPGPGNIDDPNRWQPLAFEIFIDQSGNPVFGDVPFLTPRWGRVVPFALNESDVRTYIRDNLEFVVYYDPGIPPLLPYDRDTSGYLPDEYTWGFSLVALWGSHLDPGDSVMWDISPASIGNISDFPENFEDYRNFYDAINGGDPGLGHDLNPHTGQPYEPQLVPRGDYARVLAEFWADGPDSETPPGHWFSILNSVHDHPAFVRKFEGKGEELDPLEWDVKAYLALGGAMHDAAISAWSIKGWHDYVRPISAIRYMASLGQSSDSTLGSYHALGIPLVEGFIELVGEEDSLAGQVGQHVGKIKLFTWRGPDYIENPETDMAGVGWILAENWWPYQRPTFVTPPFAGYISGHSTFSRAAAEVLTLLTGDPFFPGGLGEFEVKKNEFLVFEEGPSVDFTLQWATYRDASDQTSLSRIWGGIHPPADDIPGRIIGEKVGIQAFEKAKELFNSKEITVSNNRNVLISPNPVFIGGLVDARFTIADKEVRFQWYDIQGKFIREQTVTPPTTGNTGIVSFETTDLTPGLYVVRLLSEGIEETYKVSVLP